MTESGMLTLEPARAADRDRVRSMVEATGVFRDAEVDIALEVFDGATQHPGVDYHGLAAYEDGGVVGLTLYGPTPGTVGTWDLYWIVVDPAGHRQGVGRALMEATERDIWNVGGRLVVVETSSRSDYEPTRAFYTALQYDRAAHIEGYYAPQDDLIVFTKHLSPPPAEMGDHG